MVVRGVMVQDLMIKRVVMVTPDTPLTEAAQLMDAENVGALPVVDERGIIRGIITDRDIVLRAVSRCRDTTSVLVADHFTKDDVLSVTADTTVEEAAHLMRTRGVRRVPVVQSDGRVVGILSLSDLLRCEKEAGRPG